MSEMSENEGLDGRRNKCLVKDSRAVERLGKATAGGRRGLWRGKATRVNTPRRTTTRLGPRPATRNYSLFTN